jgi:Holliday junction DNA helicase RuvB
MDFYSPAELEQVLVRSAGCSTSTSTPDGGGEIAGRPAAPADRQPAAAPGPRLRQVAPTERCRASVAAAALAVYEVDELGLDRLDRAVLDALLRRFGGGPVGLSTLAVAVGEEPETVEEVASRSWSRRACSRARRAGRIATPAAWTHLALTPPPGTVPTLPFDDAS